MKEFDKVIGYEPIKIELSRICDIMLNAEKYKKLGVTIPSGIMLYGEPGVGKTLLANCFAEASHRKCYVCRKDTPSDEFINKIKSTFSEAKSNAPSIVLLDDFDKFANEDKDHRDAEEYVTVQSCIDEVKNRDVFVFATANDRYKIPDSLLRAGRLGISIEVNAPEFDDAKKIIEHYLKTKTFVDDIDSAEVARLLNGRSCAELESIINQAGIYAGYENKDKIEFDDIARACKRIIYDAPETILNKSSEFNIETCYHEAGHAVISEILEPNSVTMISMDNRDCGIGGFTGYYRESRYFDSIDLMKNRICTLLGGKCAVELVFGTIDVGAFSDLERARDVIERFVTNYCSVGFDKFDMGYGTSVNYKFFQEKSIADELTKYYHRTTEILVKNRVFLDRLAQNLMQKKTLLTRDIQAIKDDLQKL